jgi:hypothetical protein
LFLWCCLIKSCGALGLVVIEASLRSDKYKQYNCRTPIQTEESFSSSVTIIVATPAMYATTSSVMQRGLRFEVKLVDFSFEIPRLEDQRIGLGW